MTLLKPSVKQFFAEAKSPFFQMQLPKLNQASTIEGFSFTYSKHGQIKESANTEIKHEH